MISALSNLKPIASVNYKGMSFLEDHLSLYGYTDKVLNGEYDGSKKYLRDSILNDECKLMIESAKQRKSTEFVAHIASELSWLHLWDTMLEQGSEGTAVLQALQRGCTFY